jgi:hypothetical protein
MTMNAGPKKTSPLEAKSGTKMNDSPARRAARLTGFSLALFALLWFFRSSTWGGDGDMIARFIEGHLWYYDREPLLHFLLVLTHVLASPWHWNGMQVLNFASCLAGVWFFVTLLRLGRDWLGDPLPPVAVFLASGFTILFAGHTEYYGPVLAAGLFWFERTFRRLRREVPLWQPLAAYALFASFHLVALFAVPGVAWTLWKERGTPRLPARAAAGILPLVLLLVLVFLGPFSTTDVSIAPRLCPLRPDPLDPTRVTLFSLEHLGGWLYWQVKASPLLVPMLLLFLSPGVRRRLAWDGFQTFLASAGAGLLVFSWVWHPDLGVWADWDLFAISALAPTLLAIHAWMRSGTAARRLIWILILPAAAWTWSHILSDARLGRRGRGTIEVLGVEGLQAQVNVDGHLKRPPRIHNVLEGEREVRIINLTDGDTWHGTVEVLPGRTITIPYAPGMPDGLPGDESNPSAGKSPQVNRFRANGALRSGCAGSSRIAYPCCPV